MTPQRKTSPRLQGFNYKLEGYYFVTICVFDRKPRFGIIRNGQMILNEAGKIIQKIWLDLPNHYPDLKLDDFVIMPNHFHAIAILEGNKYSLSEVIRGFKTWSARRINKLEHSSGNPVWQRSFYDHIIREDKDLNSTCEYIANNPLKWELDNENPTNLTNQAP